LLIGNALRVFRGFARRFQSDEANEVLSAA
jgi:hypothetical protein